MLVVHTGRPQGLLAAIKQAIDRGHIKTWSYDRDGDFTHVTHGNQWANRAWLRPEVSAGALLLRVIWPQGDSPDPEVYGIFVGRFVEMLLTHFSTKDFDDAQARPFR